MLSKFYFLCIDRGLGHYFIHEKSVIEFCNNSVLHKKTYKKVKCSDVPRDVIAEFKRIESTDPHIINYT